MVSLLAADGINLFDINTLWWFLQRGILNIIDGLNEAFYLLAGVSNPFQGGEIDPGIGDNTLLLTVFRSKQVQHTFLIFCFAALLLAGFCLMLSILKNMGRDDIGAGKAYGGTIVRFFKSVFFMFAVPIIFLLGLYSMTYLLNFMVAVMGGQITTSNASVAQSLFEICCPEGAFNGEIWMWETVNYDILKKQGIADTYDYTLGIFAGCLIIFALVKVCILLVERFIDIMWLYLVAPFSFAKMPLEKDKTMDQWKEQVLVKLLSVGGIVICMYLYFFIIPQVDNALRATTDLPESYKLGRTFTRLLFIIGGAFAISKGSVKLATLISAGAAQTEGMSAAETSRMISGGTQMAIGGLTKAVGGTVAGAIGGVVGSRAANSARLLGSGMLNGSGGVAKAAQGAGATVGGVGGSGGTTQKAAKMQAKSARRQQQFMTGTNFGSVAARGGIMGMVGYGGTKLVGLAGAGIKKAASATKSGLNHMKEKRAASNGGGFGSWKKQVKGEAKLAKREARNSTPRRKAREERKKLDSELKKNNVSMNQRSKIKKAASKPENAKRTNAVDADFNKKIDKAEKDLNKFDSYLQKKGIDPAKSEQIKRNVMESRLNGMTQTVDQLKQANLDKILQEATKERLNKLKTGQAAQKGDDQKK